MHDICHVEIASTDVEGSMAFLGGLFGWSFEEMGPNYRLFRPGEGPGGGIMKVEAPAGPGGVSMYIHVAKIEETLERVPGLGGAVVRPRTAIDGGHGWYAILRDPGGSEIGVWEAPK